MRNGLDLTNPRQLQRSYSYASYACMQIGKCLESVPEIVIYSPKVELDIEPDVAVFAPDLLEPAKQRMIGSA